MTTSQYRKNIASTRKWARSHGWSLAKVNAAERCAAEWSNADQNTSGEDWNDTEWHNNTASYFCSITDGEFDGTWEDACGWKE